MVPPPGEATLPDPVVAQVSVIVNRLVARAEPYFIPPVIQVETVALEDPTEEDFDFEMLFFPSMFFLALMFVSQSLSADVWKERQLGTLRRTITTPGGLALFFLAKLCAGTLVLGVVAAAALAVGRWGLRIELANVPLAVLWSTLSGAFLLLLFTGVQLLAGSERGGSILTMVIIFPLVMAGGAFFPFEVMPDWLARVGRLTPNGWSLERLKAILTDSVDPERLLGSALGIIGLLVILYLLSLRRLLAFARTP
jgi:ABC-type multidrug transport system permease subunit